MLSVMQHLSSTVYPLSCWIIQVLLNCYIFYHLNMVKFRAFGCRFSPYVHAYSQHKLALRRIPCIFMGYSSQYKGYKCLDPIIVYIYITLDARFDESVFRFARSDFSKNIYALELWRFMEDQPLPILTFPSSLTSHLSTTFQPRNTSPCSLHQPTTPLPKPDTTPTMLSTFLSS